jgi:phytoene synthase
MSATACEAIVRQADPDRYIAALFAPAQKRPLLFALYAFNHELAHVGDVVREPMMGEIRLQWWREAVEGARAGNPRAHDVARGLAEAFVRVDLPMDLFEAMIDARTFDIIPDSFATLEALEAYADATSGNLMRLAARVLGHVVHDALAREAGIAFALAGILRAIPFHAARRKLFLPLDLLTVEGLTADDIFAGRGAAGLKTVIGKIAARAREHLKVARALPKPGGALAAFLPAAPVPLYLRKIERPRFDPFHDATNVPLYRRQLSMLAAATRGQI